MSEEKHSKKDEAGIYIACSGRLAKTPRGSLL